MSRWGELLASESNVQEWQSELLEMLAKMVAESDGDGAKLIEHAQEWIVEAREILPLAQKEWGE